MSEDSNWVRDRIVAALKKHPLESGRWDNMVEKQADAMMVLLKETACERDTYHAFVGYLNTLRLEREDG